MKFHLLRIFIFLVLVNAKGFGQGIKGTAHDFTSAGWNPATEICIICHTPLEEIASGDDPIPSHKVPSTSFSAFSPQVQETTMGQPDGISKLCLNCHDGTVAVDKYGGMTMGSSLLSLFSSDPIMGSSLTKDHPVSFTFDYALAFSDGGLFDPSITRSGLGSTINIDMLRNGKVQCVSCHEPHNKYGNSKFLRKSNMQSQLCLTCHDKLN